MKQIIDIILYDLIFMGLGILVWKLMNSLGKYIHTIVRKLKDS
jgi:hypothetical protein